MCKMGAVGCVAGAMYMLMAMGYGDGQCSKPSWTMGTMISCFRQLFFSADQGHGLSQIHFNKLGSWSLTEEVKMIILRMDMMTIVMMKVSTESNKGGEWKKCLGQLHRS